MGNKKTKTTLIKQANSTEKLQTFEFDILEWKKLIKKLQKNKSLENFALSIKRNRIRNFQNYNNYNFKNDFEKAWFIYIWITNNISFKTDVFKTFSADRDESNSLINVLTAGSCTSQGYSCLFLDLSRVLNLNCIQINGYAKGFGYSIGDKFKATNHYWNCIQLYNQWYMIDVSWGSGYCYNDFNFIKKFNPYWFLTPAQVFIYTHYSEFYQIQLNKITLNQFENMPLLKLEYHLMDFCSVNNDLTAMINIQNNPYSFEFLVPKQVTTIAELKDKNGATIENSLLLQRSKDQTKYELDIILPLKNQIYELSLFASMQQKKFDLVAKFNLIQTEKINQGSSEMKWIDKKFISIMTIQSIEFYIHSPVKFNLKVNKNYFFKIYVKDGLKVALIFNEINWIYLNNTNSIWSISRSFETTGYLQLVITTLSHKSNYKILCFYSIIT